MKKTYQTPRAGYTVVEVMIVTAIISLVLGICFSIMVGAQKVEARSTASGQLNEQARAVAEKMARDIRYSGLTCPNFAVDTTEGATQISFRRCGGYDPSLELPRWGDLVTYRFGVVDESGETSVTNGVDDNNNGVVDEGGIYRVEGDGIERLLVRDVVTFQLNQTGSTIEITLGLSRPDRSYRGEILQGTYSTSVVMRN